MPETWFLLQSGHGLAVENMAVDEALLEASARWGHPVLRFYGWTDPAATFGYFQKHAVVAGWTALRPLIRRPTAGGLVPHDADWTYSLVFPPDHWWYRLRAPVSYWQVHEWIHRAFAARGEATELSTSSRKNASGRCFVGAEKFDLLWRNQKIAGAAQRRNRDGLLIQGSVQPGSLVLSREDWESAMQETAPFPGRIQWLSLEPDRQMADRIRELAEMKYAQRAYNERR